MSKEAQKNPILTIIHFNDVYDIQDKDNKGGIVNFKVKMEAWREKYVDKKNLLVLFSGDAFSPSVLSNIFEGEQMVHALNHLRIDAACYGNHEFDFDHDHTVKLAKQCNFPWLLGNLKFRDTGEHLGLGSEYKIFDLNEVKVGIFGIAGEDWIGILGDYDEDDLQYIDYVEHSNKMCKILRQDHKCDIVIALTHMRNQPDLQLPLQVKGVDLVLGGHDHVILEEAVDKTPVIKSGCNFRNIGRIHIYDKKDYEILKEDPFIKEGRNYNFNFHVVAVGEALEEEKDQQLSKYVEQKMFEYKKHDKIVGYTEIDLETRFNIHRTQETGYGNFVADLMRQYVNASVAIANSGSIRNDCILPAGPLKYSEVSNIINDALVVKRLPGKILLETLEYSIQGLPDSFRGSFLHVSGLTYRYNSKLPPGSRIVEVLIGGVELDKERNYEVAMYSYISHGGDGFDFLKDCQVIKDQVQTTSMLNLLLKFFNTLNKDLASSLKTGDSVEIDEIPLLRKKSSKTFERIQSLQSKLVKGEDGKMYASIKPKLERRIVDVQQLMKETEQDESELMKESGYKRLKESLSK